MIRVGSDNNEPAPRWVSAGNFRERGVGRVGGEVELPVQGAGAARIVLAAEVGNDFRPGDTVFSPQGLPVSGAAISRGAARRGVVQDSGDPEDELFDEEEEDEFEQDEDYDDLDDEDFDEDFDDDEDFFYDDEDEEEDDFFEDEDE